MERVHIGCGALCSALRRSSARSNPRRFGFGGVPSTRRFRCSVTCMAALSNASRRERHCQHFSMWERELNARTVANSPAMRREIVSSERCWNRLNLPIKKFIDSLPEVPMHAVLVRRFFLCLRQEWLQSRGSVVLQRAGAPPPVAAGSDAPARTSPYVSLHS